MDKTTEHNIQEATKVLKAVHELSQLLGCNLDKESLSLCIRLCEAGVNPDILAGLVRELQREVKTAQSVQPRTR